MKREKINLFFDKKHNVILEPFYYEIDEDGQLTIMLRSGCIFQEFTYSRNDYIILPEIIVEGLTTEENYFVKGDVLRLELLDKQRIICLTENQYSLKKLGFLNPPKVTELGNVFEKNQLLKEITSF